MVATRLFHRRIVVFGLLLLNVGNVHAFTTPASLPFARGNGATQQVSTFIPTMTGIQTHRHRSCPTLPTVLGRAKAARTPSRTKMLVLPSPLELSTLADTITQTALAITNRELIKQLPMHYLRFYLLTKSAETLFFVVRPRLLALTEGRPHVPPTDYTFTWKCVVPNFANAKVFKGSSASLGLIINVGMAIWFAYEWQQSPPTLFLVPSVVMASFGASQTTLWSWSMFTLAEQSCWVLLFGQIFGQMWDHGRNVPSDELLSSDDDRRGDTLGFLLLYFGGLGALTTMINFVVNTNPVVFPKLSFTIPTDVDVDSWQQLLAWYRALPILFMSCFVVMPRLATWGSPQTSANYTSGWLTSPLINAWTGMDTGLLSSLWIIYCLWTYWTSIAVQDYGILSAMAASFEDHPVAVTFWYMLILLEQCFWVPMYWICSTGARASVSRVYASLMSPADRRATFQELVKEVQFYVGMIVGLWILTILGLL